MKETEMTKRKMTDGERIAAKVWERGLHNPMSWEADIARDIDRLIRKRQAEAWLEGWRRSGHEFPGNPYQSRKRKV